MLVIAFVLPYGEPSDGFFTDSVLSLMCADARNSGHRGHLVRVYYDGSEHERDREVARRLEKWLDDSGADIVVVDRLFDPAPIVSHRAKASARRGVFVARGDSYDALNGIDFVIGAVQSHSTAGASWHKPTVGELRVAFGRLLDSLALGDEVGSIPGVGRMTARGVEPGEPFEPSAGELPFSPVVEQEVIALGEPPRVIRKTLHGNVGCPFALDPLKNPHFAGVSLPQTLPVARLGCAFCSMGGDYGKRPDAEVIKDLVRQALHYSTFAPDVEELVLDDQHSLRFLAPLIREASAAGVRSMRWLFAARADSFLRERERVLAAVHAARDTGHRIETYLTGFEAFSDNELARYNKGVRVEDLTRAVQAMRELGREYPGVFEYARAKGHSLILWNPWTTPEDLLESVANLRSFGLSQLFSELGRNRLRLYADLPIFYAALRDGAIGDWRPGDAGAARRKGYNPERPWRFLDPRTATAYALARVLRDRLGPESEVAQLRALAELTAHVEPEPPVLLTKVEHSVDVLAETTERFGGLRGASEAPRGRQQRGAVALFSGACNNGCASCPNRDEWLDDSAQAIFARVDAARSKGQPVVLAGREPTLHAAFLAAVERARGSDARAVGVVSNGRRFAYRSFAEAAVSAGLVAASVKLFAADPGTADRISRDSGGWEQTVLGLRALREARIGALELRAPIHRYNLDAFADYAERAQELGVDQIRAELSIDAVGLDRLELAACALTSLAERCQSLKVPLEVSPLRAGTRHFEWMPEPPRGAARAAVPLKIPDLAPSRARPT